uniref:Uncharacterized protein n=1 Tax=Acrobeloides nanus TaxID=290746 RepID=A0A914EKT7_9BILA
MNRFHMSNESFVSRTCLAFDVQPREPEVNAAKPEGEFFVGKLTGLFKHGPAHQDYSTTKIYEEPLASTSRAYKVDEFHENNMLRSIIVATEAMKSCRKRNQHQKNQQKRVLSQDLQVFSRKELPIKTTQFLGTRTEKNVNVRRRIKFTKNLKHQQ